MKGKRRSKNAAREETTRLRYYGRATVAVRRTRRKRAGREVT